MQNKLRAAGPRAGDLNLVGSVTRQAAPRPPTYLITTNCYSLYMYVRHKLSRGLLLILNIT